MSFLLDVLKCCLLVIGDLVREENEEITRRRYTCLATEFRITSKSVVKVGPYWLPFAETVIKFCYDGQEEPSRRVPAGPAARPGPR
jgi:hypothetical protein